MNISIDQIERAVDSLVKKGLVVRANNGRLYAKQFAPQPVSDSARVAVVRDDTEDSGVRVIR